MSKIFASKTIYNLKTIKVMKEKNFYGSIKNSEAEVTSDLIMLEVT